MSDFKIFSAAVHSTYNTMAKAGELFVVNIPADDMWLAYLGAFPEGTNPVFRERTEHDCSCCRNFIKNLGRVVSIVDGQMITVWDAFADLPEPYKFVAKTLSAFVRTSEIEGVYRTKERSYGLEFNHERLESGDVLTWNHFHGQVQNAHFSLSPASDAGSLNTTASVFERGLKEITVEALEQVLSLIDAKALYRGEEFRSGVGSFYSLKQEYILLDTEQKVSLFPWEHMGKPAARIRNTAIGTLLQDLSEGMELEAAVRAFEKKVAPENYKRTTALITPKMIEDGLKTLRELGLESAVNRRFARLSDVSVNNVLWASGDARNVMRDTLADALLGSSQVKKAPAKSSGVISADDFMANVVPKAAQLEVMVTNQHANNFVSLTAPVDAEVGRLFKWDNNFAWSYNGNVTDSIKEKVKAAGGNVTNAKLRVSLAWFNGDDLDIHCICPDGRICFYDKRNILDVDMNAGWARNSKDPVENLSWVNPKDGTYLVQVNQYSSRSRDNVGFVVELENDGRLTQYSYSKASRSGEFVDVITFKVKDGKVVDLSIAKDVVGQGISREVWGVPTEQFRKVETLMLSPNHWDDNQMGNKHYLFMLEGCKNPEPTRGIYNEYLRQELDQHRKVFEVLGSKTMCPVVDDQLSGIGFSSTRNDLVTIRATTAEGQSEILTVQF